LQSDALIGRKNKKSSSKAKSDENEEKWGQINGL
jgi:hypothetical protein